jgi:hypothetical protein
MDTLLESVAAAEAVVPLAFPFTRGGYRHVLLARTRQVCLVERTSTHPDSRGSVHYEVVLLRHLATRVGPRGQRLPASEAYPCSCAWGRAAWTYTTRGAAERRYDAACLETPSAQEPRSRAGMTDSLSASRLAAPAAPGVEAEHCRPGTVRVVAAQ